MPTKEELYVIAVAAGVVLAANVLAMALFILFSKLPESRLKENIRSIIFELDRICDNMENPEKRRLAIQQINDILGWRKILIPSALIGWIIDMEVAAIRRMQKATDTPNLHGEGDSK
jgi:hypothetical protein